MLVWTAVWTAVWTTPTAVCLWTADCACLDNPLEICGPKKATKSFISSRSF